MYEKCLKCEHLGHDCFPNLYVMPVDEMRKFAIQLKKERKLSNSDISEISGVPKGTIDNSFSKKNADIYYTTFAPILCALLGSNLEESTCPEYIAEDFKNRETIEKMEQENEDLKERLKKSSEKNDEDTTYLKKEIKIKTVSIITLAILLFLSLSVIIAALVIDRVDSGLGFFWLGETLSFFTDETASSISNFTWSIL